MRGHAPGHGIRWRDDGWELRCDDCARAGKGGSYWPLTLEFWDPTRIVNGKRTGKGMGRCRACWLHRNNRTKADRLQDPAKRERVREHNRAYKRECADVLNFKARAKRVAA